MHLIIYGHTVKHTYLINHIWIYSHKIINEHLLAYIHFMHTWIQFPWFSRLYQNHSWSWELCHGGSRSINLPSQICSVVDKLQNRIYEVSTFLLLHRLNIFHFLMVFLKHTEISFQFTFIHNFETAYTRGVNNEQAILHPGCMVLESSAKPSLHCQFGSPGLV